MSVQIVISGNRVIAHGTGFSVSGNTVENKSTGKVYDNATIATVESVPGDINSVGYEYHAGRFVPCAPYGKGDNNGYFMEVCTSCATPRSSGIPIKGGIKFENLADDVKDEINKKIKLDDLADEVTDEIYKEIGFDDLADDVKYEINKERVVLLWQNASPTSSFRSQTISLDTATYKFFVVFAKWTRSSTAGTVSTIVQPVEKSTICGNYIDNSVVYTAMRPVVISNGSCSFESGCQITYHTEGTTRYEHNDQYCIPFAIYGVRG